MPPEAQNSGLLPLVIAFAVIGFFIFALVRARKRRKAALDALEPKALAADARSLKDEALGQTPDDALATTIDETPAANEDRIVTPPLRKIDPGLEKGLQRTKQGLVARLAELFTGRDIPSDLLQQIETILLTSDIGVKTTTKLLATVKDALSRQALKDEGALKAALKQEVEAVLELTYKGDWQLPERHPTVLLMVGVNGAGKTTTIGKLAAKFTAEGKKVLVAAGDTFRAAAADQLKVWAERAGAEYYAGAAGNDPSSVLFAACEHGKAIGVDIILADTAGRLHTKTNLMDELKKVKRVIGKVIAGAPHEVFLVVDATTGQNAVSQAREFNEALGLTGIVLSKLDGTAKGGVIVAIAAELNLPIRFVGVGESADDLRRFDPHGFAEALFA